MERYDYDEWKSCMESFDRLPNALMITRADFRRFVNLHQAIVKGDGESVERLSKRLNVRVGCRSRDVS